MNRRVIALLVLVGSVPFLFAAPPAPVPKTGQTTSFREGDDGELKPGVAWPNPRFTDLVDGTVTDNLTGLEWVKEPHLLSGNSGVMSWCSAIDLCNGLDYAGHSDWRMPNINELASLVNRGAGLWGNKPFEWLNSTETPFSGVKAGAYWSSTSRAATGYTTFACYVNMSVGDTWCSSKGDSSFYVWPVRGGRTAVPTKVIGLSGSMAFGSVQVGGTSNRTLTVSNRGNTALTVTNISYPACFSGAWSGTVGAGASTNVVVTFTPAAVTNYSGTVMVSSDATSGTNTISASGKGAVPTAPAITTVSPLPAGTVGNYYSQTLAAGGGIMPYRWSLYSAVLPSGLSLSGDGVISGTPDVVGTVNFVVRVTGSNGLYSMKMFSVKITATATAPAITTGSQLPSGSVGAAYSQTLTASGGIMPYRWSLDSGSLPSGMTLYSGGVIRGTPGVMETANFTIQVTGSDGLSSTNAFSLTTTDTMKPTVKITAPMAKQRILGTNGLYMVRGTAADNWALTNVLVQLNDGTWTNAVTTNGWKNWSLPVTLIPGTNIIRAYSVDSAVNNSLTATVACTYVVTGTLTIQTNGAGTVARAPIGEPEVGKTYTLTAAPKIGSVFSNWTGDAVSNPTSKVATITMTSNKTVVANFTDIQKPTVAITAPTALQRILGTNGLFTVRGTAADNKALTNVLVQLNGGSWTDAATTNNWKNWSLPMMLVEKTNTIRTCSVDTTGNHSLTSKVVCTYVPTARLTIETNGQGSVTRAPTGEPEVGKTYTLTATPKIGSVFSNWTGDAVSNPTSKVATITMTSNKTVTANFTDIQKPTVAFTAPTASLRILGTNPVYTVKGTATDNGVMTGVFCRVNSGDWTVAVTTNGWKSWSVPLSLTAGSNLVQAFSADSAGNLSLTSKVSCTYVVTGSLSLQTNGAGTISRTPAGLPEVNQTYTLTATPGIGFAFVNWTGDAVSNPTNKVVTFRMGSNSTFTANFTDSQRPTVAITAPTASLQIIGTNPVYTVKGTATDNKAVAEVKVQLNSGEWTNAVTTNVWKNWSVPVTLVPGTNTIRAYSVDTTGNSSLTSRVTCTYVEKFVLADYDPAPQGAEWLYEGLDEYGDPAKMRARVDSVNYTIENYTGRTAPRSYTTNCVRVSCAYLNRTTMVAYESWTSYGVKDQSGTLGSDYENGDTIRVDRGLVFPSQMALGEKVSVTRDLYYNGQFFYAATESLQLIEKTSLTVPAGTFTNVLHVRSTFRLPDGTTTIGDSWVAKSVGEIKYVGISSDDLLNFELIQYSVPSAPSEAAAEIAQSVAVSDISIDEQRTAAPEPTAQAAITVDGLVKDWANVPRSSFSYASVTQEVAVALDGNNIALLLKDCPFETSDTVLVYFKLRLSYGSGDNRHSVDLWTSGSVLYGMVDGQVITGLEAVLLNGVLEVKLPVEQAPSQVTIEEIGCGMDFGGGTLTELFRLTPPESTSTLTP